MSGGSVVTTSLSILSCVLLLVARDSTEARIIFGIPRLVRVVKVAEECSLPAGFVAHHEMDVAYKYFRLHKSWHEARKYCISNGGHLAVIDTREKLSLVKDIAKPSPIGNYNAWIGIHNSLIEDEWTAITYGEPLESLPWSEGRPTRTNEWHCVAAHFSPRNDTASLWNVACTADTPHFICEISISDFCGNSQR